MKKIEMLEKIRQILNELYIIDDQGNTIPADGVDYYTDRILEIIDEAVEANKNKK